MYMEKLGIQGIIKGIYRVSKEHAYFPALTGGYLYKDGFRKDVDIVMYEKRDNDGQEMGNLNGLLQELVTLGFWFKEPIKTIDNPRYFVYKAIFQNEVPFNFMFPGNHLSDSTYDPEGGEGIIDGQEMTDWEVRYAELHMKIK